MRKNLSETTQKKKRLYLSLPISNYDLEERRATAGQKKRELESMGYDVFNPLSNGLPADAGTHAHMKRDIEMLLGCDAIYMMERWLHSAGCKCEFDVATAIGLEVYFEDCRTVEYGEFVKFK